MRTATRVHPEGISLDPEIFGIEGHPEGLSLRLVQQSVGRAPLPAEGTLSKQLTIMMDIRLLVRKFWLIVFLLLVFPCLKCTGDREKTIPSALKDKIVFLCSDGICTINSDGTDLKVIVPAENEGPFSDTRWSPDKRKIGFTGHVDGDARIFLVNSDGSHRRVLGLPKESLRIPDKKYDLAFAGWSPSGKYVLYRYHEFIGNVHYGIMTVKGKVVTTLGSRRPSFGGDDNVVYVVYYHASKITVGADIFMYNINTKEKRNLTNTGGQRPIGFYPFLSPDGKLVAFTYYGVSQDESKRELVYELWITQSAGSGKRKLASWRKDFEGHWLRSVKFSPDGQMIMFIRDEGGKSRIYIVNTDGTGLQAITDRIVKATGGASWSPDGEQIVFTSSKDGNDELYIVNVDGTGLTRLTNNSTPDCCPDC